MPEWIAQNLGTIIVCIILAVFFAILILSLIRDRKTGKSSCCGGCSGCAMAGQCHSAKTPTEAKDTDTPTDTPTNNP